MRKNVCFIIYHTWLYRKRHIPTTCIQILAPVCIIMLFTVKSHFSYKPLETQEQEKKFSEQELIASLFKHRCERPLQISYFTDSEDEKLVKAIIQSLRTLLQQYSTGPGLMFFSVAEKDDIVKAAILNHLYKKPECYFGGVLFSLRDSTNREGEILKSELRNGAAKQTEIPSLRVELWMSSYFPYFDNYHFPLQMLSNPGNSGDYVPLLGLQIAITRAYDRYLQTQEKSSKDPATISYDLELYLKPFPPSKPCTFYMVSANAKMSLHDIVCISIVLGQTFMVLSIVRGPSLDRQSGFRLYLKHVGLPNSVYWIAWWINEFTVRCFVCGLEIFVLFVTILEDYVHLVQRGNFAVWATFLVFYNMYTLSFFLFCSSFSKHGAIGTYVVTTLWLTWFYCGHLFLNTKFFHSTNWIYKVLLFVSPNFALEAGIKLLVTTPSGVDWSNIFTYSELSEVGLSLGAVIGICLFDSLLLMVLTIFIDNQRTEQRNIGFLRLLRPFFSVWTKKLCNDCFRWCRGLFREEDFVSVNSLTAIVDDILFQDVTIEAKRNVRLLDDVNLEIHANMRTAIVGSHGSGKTALARLICGVYPPTKGNVYVSGCHSVTEKSLIRTRLSYCPERNRLCDYLSLFEHLKLIGVLRGYSMGKARTKSKEILEAMELTNFRHKFPGDLVGIQKRKLCIAMSLIGKSKVIVFDSPTADMETDTAFQILTFIMNYCKGKTLLLLTQRFSEAYFFGERLAFLANGKIIGTGTRDQLESCLQVGYHLQVQLSQESDPKQILTFVQERAPQSEKIGTHSMRIQRTLHMAEQEALERAEKSKTGFRRSRSRLSSSGGTTPESFFDAKSALVLGSEDSGYYSGFNLPEYLPQKIGCAQILLLKLDVSKFPDLFKSLDDLVVKQKYGILSYTVVPHTLEHAYEEIEQYMRLDEVIKSYGFKEVGEAEEIATVLLAQENEPRGRPLTHFCCRLLAEIIKKISFAVSNLVFLCSQFLAPLLLLLIIIGASERLFQEEPLGPSVDYSVELYYNRPVPIKLPQKFSPLYHYLKNIVNLRSAPVSGEKADDSSHILTLQRSEDPVNSETYLSFLYPVGLEVHENKLTALYSPSIFHSAPTALSVALNTYLRYKHGVSIHYVGRSIQYQTEKLLKYYKNVYIDYDENPVYLFAIFIAFGFFFFTSKFVVQPLNEKMLHLKHLQLRTGLSRFTYWLSFYLWDILLTLVLGGMMLLLLYYLPPHLAYLDSDFWVHFLILIFVAGTSCIMHTYAISFVFIDPATCFFATMSYSQFTGLFAYVAVTLVPNDEITNILKCMLMILQPFSVVSGFAHLFWIAFLNIRCKLVNPKVQASICANNFRGYSVSNESVALDRSCCDQTLQKIHYVDLQRFKNRTMYEDFFIDLIVLSIHALLAALFIVSMERSWYNRYVKRYIRVYFETLFPDDDDGSSSEDHDSDGGEEPANINRFEVQEIEKKFFGGAVLLRDITFSASSGELVAIVGPDKSGKTLLSEILTGLRPPSRGRAFCTQAKFEENTIVKNFNYLSNIGYVPSHYVLEENSHMKGKSMLQLFARLRKIPLKHIDTHVKKWAKLLGLEKHYTFQYQYYARPVRQRLALAMAFIGEPPILVLDEPLKYLDPLTKQQFWKIISYLRQKQGRIIILLTSEINDLENVTKIGILVNGEMQSFQSPSAWKSEVEENYVVQLKFKDHTSFLDWNKVKVRFLKEFPESLLRQEHRNSLDYWLGRKDGTSWKWATLFGKLESLLTEYPEILSNYCISEESLEHRYESFAKNQRPYRKPIFVREELCLKLY